ncbi:MAG: class I SAM-dependent methyltransferase [Candidatus Omnitrophica bacterium]|nr:class I SAM-dependent methyltransferase [Candidatus Omnitrophota bacterium]
MITIRKNINNIDEFHSPAGKVAMHGDGQSKSVKTFNKLIAEGKVRLEEVPCLCGGETFDLIASIDRHNISQKTVVCTRCGLVQSNPRMMKDDCRDFYCSDLYRRCYEGDDYIATAERRYEANYGVHIYEVVKKVRNIQKGMSVFEVGAGGGWNLIHFMKAGATVEGLEYSPSLVEFGKRHGVKMTQCPVSPKERAHDLIIASHVLEHAADPLSFLLSLTKQLKDDGLIYVEVPNILDFSIKQLQSAHIYYFTPATLRRLCAAARLGIVFRGSTQGGHLFVILKKASKYKAHGLVKNDYWTIRCKMLEVKLKYMVRNLLKNVRTKNSKILDSHTKIKKVIYIVESPFCQRDRERFGIELVRQAGFEVEIWDFTPFLYREVHDKVKVKDPTTISDVKTVLTHSEALGMISNLEKSVFVMSMLFYGPKTFQIFKAITKAKLKYAIFAANAIPNINVRKTKEDIFRKLRKMKPKNLLDRICMELPFYLMGIKPATFLLAGGANSTIAFTRFPVNANTKTIWMHSLDYDIYLQERRTNCLIDNKMGVFLDEDVCFHPEYVRMGEPPFSTAGKYFSILTRFFDDIKDRYGVEITIAAHPRSKYEDFGDFFSGRQVTRWRTAELVKKSAFVIAHSSTSISFAVLFRKPIIFITTDDLENSPQGGLIKTMAMQFNKKPININKVRYVDLEKEMFVDDFLYTRYKEHYIKRSISKDVPFWEIFAHNLKEVS